MLIVDDKIAFVHMKKCAGSSFCRGLINLLPTERVFFLGYTKEGEARSAESRRAKGIWKHSTANEILSELDPDRTRIEKVYLLSNRPFWERVASFYYYCKRHNERDAAKYPWAGELSFKEYLRSNYVEFTTIADYALDQDGNVLVDEVIDFDKISTTYREVCDGLGFPGEEIPVINANPTPINYRSCYDQDDWELVVSLFRVEIEFLSNLGKSLDLT